MKKIYLFAILLVPLMFCFFLGAGNDEENTKIIAQEEVINDDIFYSGIYFENNGKVEGNILVRTQKSLVNGEINGNAFIYSDTVQLNGHITGDVIFFGNEIIITGKVEGNIYALGTSSVTLETTSEIMRNSYIFSQNVSIFGSVERNAIVLATNELNVRGLISGNLTYNAQKINIIESGITGNVEVGQFFSSGEDTTNSFTKVISVLSFIFTNLIIWFLLTFVFKETRIKTLLVLQEENKFKVFFLYGLLAIVLGLALSFLLILSYVSLAFGIIFLAILFSLIYLSSGVFIVTLSNYISSSRKILQGGNNIFMVILVSILFGILLVIPGVSILTNIIISIFGFGLLLSSFFIKLKYEEDKQR